MGFSTVGRDNGAARAHDGSGATGYGIGGAAFAADVAGKSVTGAGSVGLTAVTGATAAAPLSGGESAPGRPGLRRHLLAAKRQWWVVLVCVVLAAGGAAGYTRTTPVTYRASATLTVGPSTASAASAAASGTATVTGPDPAAEARDGAVVQAASTASHLPVGRFRLSASYSGATSVVVTVTAPSAAQASAAVNAAADALATRRIQDLEAEAAALNDSLTKLTTQIAALQAQGGTLSAGGSSTTTKATKPNIAASTELAVATANYQALYQQQQSLQLAATWIQVSTPDKPGAATPVDSKRKILALAIVAGLLAGLGIAVAREQIDDKIRTPAEVAEIGSSEVLARLPSTRLSGPSGTIADAPFDPLAESVRELRTGLRFLSVQRPLRTILVTSSVPGEGKSFVAANLAAAWAMSGARTVLVSSDLRHPALERLTGATRFPKGLSEAIADAALVRRDGADPAPGAVNGIAPVATRGTGIDVGELLVPTAVEGLYLLPAGPTPPNPAELLGSPEFDRLLAAVREQADVVVLDSPPVLAVTDALVMTAQADGVVFVVAQGRTSRASARRALHTLAGGLAPVLGVVINRSSRADTVGYYGAPAGRRRRFGRRRSRPA